MQIAALRKIKKWLNPPKSLTASDLYHPNLIDIPELTEFRTKAKLTFLASITTSQDPFIKEIVSSVSMLKMKIPWSSVELLANAKSWVATITSKTLSTQWRREVRSGLLKITVLSKRKQLSVQSKAVAVVELEDANWVWRRITQALPHTPPPGWAVVLSPESWHRHTAYTTQLVIERRLQLSTTSSPTARDFTAGKIHMVPQRVCPQSTSERNQRPSRSRYGCICRSSWDVSSWKSPSHYT